MRATLLIGLVAGAGAAAAPGPKDKDPPKPHPLVGEWEIVTVTTQGNTRPWEFGGIHVFTADGQWTTKFGRPDDPPLVWKKYAADDKADPKTLDLILTDKGQETRWRLLYRVDGDTLTLCQWGDDHTVRPKEFEAGKGSKNIIQTLKKVTPKK